MKTNQTGARIIGNAALLPSLRVAGYFKMIIPVARLLSQGERRIEIAFNYQGRQQLLSSFSDAARLKAVLNEIGLTKLKLIGEIIDQLNNSFQQAVVPSDSVFILDQAYKAAALDQSALSSARWPETLRNYSSTASGEKPGDTCSAESAIYDCLQVARLLKDENKIPWWLKAARLYQARADEHQANGKASQEDIDGLRQKAKQYFLNAANLARKLSKWALAGNIHTEIGYYRAAAFDYEEKAKLNQGPKAAGYWRRAAESQIKAGREEAAVLAATIAELILAKPGTEKAIEERADESAINVD